MLATTIDWTQVLMLGIPAYIAAIGGAVAAIMTASNRRALRTPSGGRIGEVAERAEHIAHATNASVQQLHERLNGENVLPASQPNG